jgi:anti-anti-sigma factor
VLDLVHVTFIDSMGLRAILLCHAQCERHGCAFALARAQPQAQRLFEITGLLDRLPFAEALA